MISYLSFGNSCDTLEATANNDNVAVFIIKEGMANLVTPLNWILFYLSGVCICIYGLLVFMNGHPNDMCSNEIGQCDQNVKIILDAIIKISEGTYVTIWEERESSICSMSN